MTLRSFKLRRCQASWRSPCSQITFSLSSATTSATVSDTTRSHAPAGRHFAVLQQRGARRRSFAWARCKLVGVTARKKQGPSRIRGERQVSRSGPFARGRNAKDQYGVQSPDSVGVSRLHSYKVTEAMIAGGADAESHRKSSDVFWVSAADFVIPSHRQREI